MKASISVKKNPKAPRRPSFSASHGMARQPRIVAKETSMMAREASCAAAGPTLPAASASAVTAAGTYTVPAQRPQMEASMYKEFRIVLRRIPLEKSIANGCQILQERTTPSFCRQRCGSGTPCRTPASSSAGNLIANGSQEKGKSPSAEEQGKEQSAVIADIAFRCGNAGTRQQLAQGRHQDEGVNK